MSNQDTTPIEDAENIQEQAAEEEAPEDGAASELEAARKQAQEYFEGWQRERADFSNYKKRAERDLMTMRFNAKIDTLKSLLPVLDDFERAMENLPEDLREQPWPEGISAIQRKLLKTLEEHGVQPVDPTGEMFDPNLHEAIGKDSTADVPSGHITVTLQKGYVAGDRVLRPALVRVAE